MRPSPDGNPMMFGEIPIKYLRGFLTCEGSKWGLSSNSNPGLQRDSLLKKRKDPLFFFARSVSFVHTVHSV